MRIVILATGANGDLEAAVRNLLSSIIYNGAENKDPAEARLRVG